MKKNKMPKRILALNVITILFLSIASVHAQSIIPPGAQVETIVTGLKQPEGPVWIDSLGLLFSDIMANKIYLWSPTTQQTTVFLSPSDSSNGLTLDNNGNLFMTQMLKRRVVRRTTDGTIIPLAETFRGKKFNSPNDVVVKSDGSIFFTDPDFNVPTGQVKELPFKGIYRISPSGNIQLLDSLFDKPNGICFSPDEKYLYVNESAQRKIYVWDVVNDSLLTNKRLFYTITTNGYADGMKTDSAGNLYCAGPTGVWIISPEGTYLAKIATSLNPSNCTWGDADRKTLYITAGYGQGAVYRIRLTTPSGIKQEFSRPQGIELFQNYPNPCNPSTNIRYCLPERGTVSLDIYDTAGRKITSLLQCEQEAGVYEVRFDSRSYANGVYYYCLTFTTPTKEFQTLTKRFLILK